MSCTRRSNLAIRLYAPASTGTATIAGSLDHTNYISRPGDAAAATTALSARERGLVLDRRDRRRAA
jgi:hypothetical protein